MRDPTKYFNTYYAPGPRRHNSTVSVTDVFGTVNRSNNVTILPTINFTVGTVVNGRRCGATRNRNLSLIVSATIYTLNYILFAVVFFPGGQREIPCARRGIDLGRDLGFMFAGGGLLVISLAGFANFNENMCDAMDLCVTICLLNSGSLGVTLLLPVNVNATMNVLVIGGLLGVLSAGGICVMYYLCNTLSLAMLFLMSGTVNFIPGRLAVPFLVVGFFIKLRRNGAGLAPGMVVTSYISRVR